MYFLLLLKLAKTPKAINPRKPKSLAEICANIYTAVLLLKKLYGKINKKVLCGHTVNIDITNLKRIILNSAS